MILKCPNCFPHPYQDQRYGDRMRSHTPGKPKNQKDPIPWRCTVCRHERTAA